MMGLSVAMTIIAFPPRRMRISVASRSRIRLMAALDGLSCPAFSGQGNCG
jgi:hypothetical protein